ncbi:MAG: SDR family oxidoreductase [Solirubrobacteraceae bacterium]|jgi:3-oxoacyl-[acyl-carrier protein] reductase
MTGVLAGRSALITGASRGLGFAIAAAYLDAGASVFLCARESAALEVAHESLSERCRDGQLVASLACDVADPEAVTELVATATERLPGLAVLVNNAGIYGPKGPIEAVEWSDWIRAIEINLLGSVLVARALIPQLRQIGWGKIIQLSGGGATGPLPGLSAYAASKAAVVRFAETLALELRGAQIDVNALAPGALNTRLLDEVLGAGPERVGADFYKRALAQREEGGTPLERGADLAVWLASGASDGITGKLISAVWDPWSELGERRAELDSDIYTLRRIIPADRGMSWGDPSP